MRGQELRFVAMGVERIGPCCRTYSGICVFFRCHDELRVHCPWPSLGRSSMCLIKLRLYCLRLLLIPCPTNPILLCCHAQGLPAQARGSHLPRERRGGGVRGGGQGSSAGCQGQVAGRGRLRHDAGDGPGGLKGRVTEELTGLACSLLP